MAIEEQILSEISRSVARVSDSSESFRTTANQQNSNIQRIVKDISSMFRQQSASQAEMSSSIDELNDQMAKTNEKNEGIASSLSETIAVQNSMLGELKGIGSSMDNLSNMIMMMMQNGGGGGGGGGGGAGSIGDNLSSMVLKTLGLAGVVTAGAAGVNMVSNMGRSEPAGDQISNITAALRQQESGSVQGDYTALNPKSSASGAYGFTDGTWKDATEAAGIGKEYTRAMDAPQPIQDEVARKRVEYLLSKVGGDVNQIPVMWHGGETRANDPSRVNAADEKYRTEWNQKYQQIAQQQGSQNPAATQTSASSPNTSTDFKEFLAARQQPGVDAQGLNPDFANRLMKAIQAAEQATGEKVTLTSGVRTYARQAQLYANKQGESFTGKDGKVYEPNGEAPEKNPVALPGRSLHESGDAVDIADGKAREWIRANALQFGLQDLKGDPPHFTSNGKKRENANVETAAADTSNVNFAAAVAALNAEQPQQGETLMAGLGMPAGMGPSSEPTPVGMGDMSSYNPMGILGALSGGNMFGPSGQMGAAGAAISVLGAAASQFEPSSPDDRGTRLNRAAVQQTTEAAAPWVNPDAPQEQPMQQESTPQQQSSPKEVSQDTYNHPSDRNVSVSWMDKILGVFPNETSGVNQTWVG